MKWIIVALVLQIMPMSSSIAQDDLSVMTRWRMYSDIDNALYKHIANEAYEHLDARENRLSLMRTRATWELYRNTVKRKLENAFGPLPEKTPLNARVTATFEHEGLTVENILFESRPGFQVTAALFKRSDLSGKLPVVVYVSGHTGDGYRALAYQHVIMNLARKGMAVLAIDPISQGERLQYIDPQTGESVVKGTTSEHSYAGLQYLLIGRTMAMVRLWDCIRAVDYLHTRADIDTERIGVHGRSGGGTMSSFLGAMDDRILAAAPECYITSFRRLFQSIGPQDAEQNLLSQVSSGLDHADFLFARAPKPTLLVTTTNDFFSLQGARETLEQLKPAFDALGNSNAIAMVEDEAPHLSTKNNREKVYAFFMKAFGISNSADDEIIPPLPHETLTVTTSGQVTSSGSKNIHDFIASDSAPYIRKLERERSSLNDRKVARIIRDARRLSGYEAPAEITPELLTGRLKRDGYTIEKLVLDSHGSLPIPSLLFRPDDGNKHPAVLCVSQQGKAAESAVAGLHEALVKAGYIVLACDLPGFGETTIDPHNDDSIISGVSYNTVFGAQLIGRSTTGIIAGSISSALTYLSHRRDVDENEISAVSQGITGPALLHAAVFDNTVKKTILVDMPESWSSLAETRFYDQNIGYTIVPSALTAYDLPDLMCAHAGRDIMIVSPLDGSGKETDSVWLKGQIAESHQAANSRADIKSGVEKSQRNALIQQWLNEK